MTLHNVDWIYRVEEIQPDNETTITLGQRSAGGSGANTLSTLGQLGFKVACLGMVGSDENGRFLIEELRKSNVDTGAVYISTDGTHTTGHTSIYADEDGRRAIYHARSINHYFAECYHAKDLSTSYLAKVGNSRLLHISSFPAPAALTVQEELVRMLSPRQVLSFNPGAFQSKFGLRRLRNILQRTNVLFVYDVQLKRMLSESQFSAESTEELIDNFFQWRLQYDHSEPFVLVLKNSPELIGGANRKGYITAASSTGGKYVLAKTDHLQLPPKSGRPFDSTGAGDACAAGMIYGLFKLATFEESVDLSFGLALRVSRQIGGRPSVQPEDIPSLGYLDYGLARAG